MKYMKKNGYSLLDLIMILVLILIVSALVSKLVISRKKSNRRYTELSEMQRNIRSAMEIICSEFQMVEYKVRERGFKCDDLARWINVDQISEKADPIPINKKVIISGLLSGLRVIIKLLFIGMGSAFSEI